MRKPNKIRTERRSSKHLPQNTENTTKSSSSPKIASDKHIVQLKLSRTANLVKIILSFLKLFRFGIITALFTALLGLGNYFYSSISTRASITDIWRQGYSSENRDRVTKFLYVYKNKWTVDCKPLRECKVKTDHSKCDCNEISIQGDCRDDCCLSRANQAIYNMFSRDKLFDTEFILKDQLIKELVESDIAIPEDLNKLSVEERIAFKQRYTQAILNYRNAIFETLNTIEAVKAVIEARPLPFRTAIFYKDTLEDRYKDIITELTNDLCPCIKIYRDITSGRKAPAWVVLTSEDSISGDILLTISLLLFILIPYFLFKYAKNWLYKKERELEMKLRDDSKDIEITKSGENINTPQETGEKNH